MKPNLGSLDRSLRLVAGLAIIGAGLFFDSGWALLGLVPVFTAFIGACPAYLPFGFSTLARPAGKKTARPCAGLDGGGA
jgi:hypothetical protein